MMIDESEFIYIYIYNDKHRIQKLLSNAHSISDMLMIDCHCVISECKEDVSAWMRTFNALHKKAALNVEN